jgi:hypothetical protein
MANRQKPPLAAQRVLSGDSIVPCSVPYAIRYSPFAIRHSPFAIRHFVTRPKKLDCFASLAVTNQKEKEGSGTPTDAG